MARFDIRTLEPVNRNISTVGAIFSGLGDSISKLGNIQRKKEEQEKEDQRWNLLFDLRKDTLAATKEKNKQEADLNFEKMMHDLADKKQKAKIDELRLKNEQRDVDSKINYRNKTASKDSINDKIKLLGWGRGIATEKGVYDPRKDPMAKVASNIEDINPKLRGLAKYDPIRMKYFYPSLGDDAFNTNLE